MKNTGLPRRSVGRMSMRATSKLWLIFFLCSVPIRGRAGGDYEEARLHAGAGARDLQISRDIEGLLRKKEAEVAVRRRQGIELLQVYLRDHAATPETAEV